jgi:hypothetical protein
MEKGMDRRGCRRVGVVEELEAICFGGPGCFFDLDEFADGTSFLERVLENCAEGDLRHDERAVSVWVDC